MKDGKAKYGVVGFCTAAIILAGCQTTGQGTGGQDQQQGGKIFGALLGAAAGAFLGSKVGKGKGQLAAVAAGALIGAMVGSAIFESLSRQNKIAHVQTRQLALEETGPGEWREWNDPDAGTKGLWENGGEFPNSNNDPCKKLQGGIFTPNGNEQIAEVWCKNSATGEWIQADASGQPKGGAWQPSG